MSSIPPLQPLSYATPQPARTDLRQIAVRQRAIMYCILGYVCCAVAQFVVPTPLKMMLAFGALAAGVTGAVFVFMLAVAIYNTGVGVLLGILTLIPLIGLIVLLIINSKATSLLKAHGIRVGLLGADVIQIP